MKISYAITVCNEEVELQKLVTFLLKHKELQDEIVITYDSKNGSKGVEEYLRSHSVNGEFNWHTLEFNGNFSDLKNHTKSKCSGDYIFHLDADEIPHEVLMEQLHTILEMNDVELVWVPRVNIVEGLTDEWIKKWGWTVSDKGWVNYPDYQGRVFRNNNDIHWQGRVHERIMGCKTYSHLPPHEELSLYHSKVLDKQIKQNELYTEIITGPDKYEPISLDYFLNMELATGGGGKELINQDGKLETVNEVVNFFKNDTNMISVKDKLTPNNWQYFNCMMAEFKKDVDDHHSLGWDKMTEEYYNSLELMSDVELEVFLKENPVEFDNGFIKHSYHRAVAMIGRLICDKSYIPFYMKKQKIYNEPWENDNKIRIKTPLSNFSFSDELNSLPKSEYCLTQSSILALMGIRSNDDFDLIVTSKLRAEMNIGTGAVKGNNIEIFPENYSKFMINGVQNDDDLIKNYTFQFEGYNFLEPRFYFSRKHKQGERNKTDWIAIKNFYELESFKGYPYSKCTVDKWGFEYL